LARETCGVGGERNQRRVRVLIAEVERAGETGEARLGHLLMAAGS